MAVSACCPQEALKADLFRRFSRPGQWQQRLRWALGGMGWSLAMASLEAARRLLELFVALALLAVLLPLPLAWLGLSARGAALRRTPRVGRWGEVFGEYSLALPDGAAGRLLARLRLDRLPVLLNILRGEMSFIGPRPGSLGELSLRERAVRKRQAVRPGLVCLWWLRKRANIAYESEVEVDGEYIDTRSLWGDLSIALRALPAAFYGQAAPAPLGRVCVLGIPLDNLTMSEAVATMVDRLGGGRPCQVCFVNAACANIACRDREYLEVLRRAELRLADGIGLKLAGRMLGRDIRQNVNGTDLFPRLCQALDGSGRGVFLLGARPGVVEGVRDWLAREYPGVLVSGCRHGYFAPGEEEEVVRRIAASGAQVLLVALGVPDQEKWISRHLERTGVRLAMGVGGLFDFYSGRIPRAPLWMRELGLEWFYRFCQEPRRMWRRYFVGNALFLFRVLRETLSARGGRSCELS